jgi:uncharacterized protein YjiS (DUF1127 family)
MIMTHAANSSSQSLSSTIASPGNGLLGATLGRAFLGAISGALIAAADVLLNWQQRIGDRHALRTMDEHMLKDIGLSQADVEREAGKPFWRA